MIPVRRIVLLCGLLICFLQAAVTDALPGCTSARALAVVPAAAEAAARNPVVETVTARVTAGETLPLPVRQRMENSVRAIGEQLLAGKAVSEVQSGAAGYEEVILQVFDKVLVGYTVQAVRLQPGSETSVEVVLLPWQDRIRAVQVNLQAEGLHPELAPLLYQDISGMEDIFQNSLKQLPVAAVDWTHGLLKKQVTDFLQERAPEFRADFDVQVGETTQVNLVLYPMLPVVRTVDLNMRSDTMLNAGLLLKRQKMQDEVDELLGVPVGFTARHKQFLEAKLADVLNRDPDCQALNMHTVVTITPGEHLSVMSRSDSDLYRIRLEGWADVGNNRANEENSAIMARLHMGRMLSTRDELFAQVDFFPQAVKWEWAIGYRYALPSETSLALLHDMRDDYIRLEFLQPLSRKWLLRYEYRDLDHHSEYGLRYKLHDFLSVEYALDSHDSWLRFIGYF